MRFRSLAVLAALAAVCALGAVGVAFGDGGSDRSTLFAALSGDNELDPTLLRKGAGDPDGSGGSALTFDGTELCYGITVKNIDTPVAAHIHRGKGNENGPVVVPLAQPTSGDPGASSACAIVDGQLAAEIMGSPGAFYVNVHTATFPGGAVRGQLFKN
jgi:hypothetical protein